MQSVSDIGLSLASIDVPELSLRNFIDYYPNAERGIAVVSVRDNEGKLLIVKQSSVCFSRQFSIAFNGVTNTYSHDDIVLEIQRSLDYYERQMGQTPPVEIFLSQDFIDADGIAYIATHVQQSVSFIDFRHFQLKMVGDIDIRHDDLLVVGGAGLRREVSV